MDSFDDHVRDFCAKKVQIRQENKVSRVQVFPEKQPYVGKDKIMSSTIPIVEVKFLLRKKDDRTATDWCKRNGVKIYHKETGRYRFVYAADFHNVYHRDLIHSAEIEFGDNAPEAIEAYLSNDFLVIKRLREGKNETSMPNNRYVPKGEIEKAFLDKIRRIKV